VSVDDRRDDDTRAEARDDTQDEARDSARDGTRDDVRDDSEDRRDDDVRDDGTGDDDARSVTSGDAGGADAVAAALRHTPGTAVSADLGHADDRGGRAAWEVDVLSGNGAWHSVRVGPGTGRVIGDRAQDEDDTAEVRAALKGASVTAWEAAKAVGGKGTVTSVDLDDGRDAAWEVETRDGSDWWVDPNSGKVTADRSDDD
jgi:uncharacterized membrane protein YkoI